MSSIEKFAIEWWPIERPKPYEKNARKVPQKAIDKVAMSLKEYNWRQPIVVDEHDVIIAGHTRILGARKLGMKEVPVHVATGLTAAQVKAYRLMDNRSHQETDWDLQLLGPELLELKGMDLDLSLTGFDMPEIEALLMSSPEEDAAANEAPPLPENPVSRLGDLWLLGGYVTCPHCGTKNEV